MRRIIAYLIKTPTWVNLAMFSLFIFGFMAMMQLRYSFFPETPPDQITVQVIFPGASPDEVAEGVVLKVEENLDGLDGVERVTSVSRENVGTVTVEAARGTEMDKLVADVKNAVDRINSFPLGAEKPIIYEQSFRMRSLSVVLYGETDLYNLKYIADELRDELLATPEVSQVEIAGLPSLEISIELSEADMRRYRISFDEISAAVRQANLNISGGKFETSDEEILIRAWGQDYYADALNDIVVRSNPDGTVVHLMDVASVKEQWEDTPDQRFFNGHSCVMLNIDQTEQEDILAIADRTYKIIDDFDATHANIHAQILDDTTIPLRQRLELLVKNGLIGLLLVIIALGFFLNLRLSFWVSLGIPISFAGMFIVVNFAGITLNVISLFGMILVVGILVDDAIVVGENIFAHYERGKSALQAAIDGTMEVIAPVFTSVMTTIIVFIPFFFFDGRMGRFVWQMAIVVIASLAFSLIEAFTLLPCHLAHSKGMVAGKKSSPLRQRIERGIKYLTNHMYAPTLRFALKHKWITVVTPMAMIMITVGLLRGGLIGVTFFQFIDSDQLPVNVTLTPGVQESATNKVLERIENIAWEVNEEFKSEREDHLDVITGVKRELGSNTLGESGSHTGSLTLQLLEGEQRDMESTEIANRIRDRVGLVPNVKHMTFGSTGHFGKPVSISLLGNDITQLDRARDMLVAALEDMPAVKDVTDSDQEGRREISLTLKPQAYALGLSVADIAGQVRQGFFGQEIQRIQRGKDEIRVWVRYRPEDRSAIGQLDDMRIRTPQGEAYPFAELADYTIERGIASIQHLDRKREIKVEATQANMAEPLPPILEEIEAKVLPPILAQVQGVKASMEGQSRDQGKTQASMKVAFPLALFGMFILVVLVFRSYAQALLIFSLIPIGILGAIWGHGIHGMQVSMMSLFGLIALSGIIINDSIVLVDQINRNLKEGMKVYDAIYEAGLARLRPILLTTLTTAFGLAPLMLETSRQAQFLIPMALSVAYGLIFGTAILLLILPSAFLAFSTVRCLWVRLRTGQRVTAESVEPAVKELAGVEVR